MARKTNQWGHQIVQKLRNDKFLRLLPYLFISLLIFSTIISYITSSFYNLTYFESPQPSIGTDLDQYYNALQSYNASNSDYKRFFQLDIVWSAILVILGILFFTKIYKKYWKADSQSEFSIPVDAILISGVAAWILDFTENILFLAKHSSGILTGVMIGKMISYAIFFILIFYYVFRLFFGKDNRDDFVHFLKSSFLSILLIIMLFGLLTMSDQGGAMLIHIFNTPLNLLYLILLTNFAAIVLSHFPSHFEAGLSGKNNWHKYPLDSSSIFGIIHFQDNFKSGSGKSELDSILRRSLGTILFLVWVYIILYTANLHFLHFQRRLIYAVMGILSFAVVYRHYVLMKMASSFSYYERKEDKSNLTEQEIKEFDKLKPKMERAISWLLTLSLMLIVLTAITIILLLLFKEWNVHLSWLLIILFLINAFWYVYFRETRVHLKYYQNISDKWRWKYLESLNDVRIVSIFGKSDEDNYATSTPIGLPFIGNLSNHIYFLRILKWVFLGFLATTLFFSLFFVTYLSPIIYIIFYLTALIYVIPVISKHFIYYRQNLGNAEVINKWKNEYDQFSEFKFNSNLDKDEFVKSKERFLFWTPITLLFIIIVGSAGIVLNNDLHKFPFIPEDSNKIVGLETFKKNFILNSKGKDGRATFTVASFGGGLKSNYWTLNILDKIENDVGRDFFESTLSMSGASGGAIGLACYPFIYGKKNWERTTLIEDIGRANILAIDASYLLFNDFFRELIPRYTFPSKGSDRSHKAMEQYHNLLTPQLEVKIRDQNFHQKSFYNQWYDFYNELNYYPVLIMNTTSTNRNYGYAIGIDSIHLDGGINIADFKHNRSISYFDASSTVNRFAFVSPAAAVPEKGHFVDGGYFENSGLLSTTSFYEKFAASNVEVDSTSYEDLGRPNYKISLINGKGYWIRHLLRNDTTKNDLNLIEEVSQTAEIPAIISTIAGTEMLPTYYIDKYESDTSEYFIPIYMPLIFDMSDVESVLGGKVPWKNRNDVIRIINNNKDSISRSLQKFYPNYKLDKWGIVQPSLARLLSEPDRQYQKAMICNHYHVREQICKIKALVEDKAQNMECAIPCK